MTVVDQSASSSQTATVFVSYARADRKAVQPIIAALEVAGFSVWWDGLIEGGERFLQTTESALETAQAVVVLWSKTSVTSHWVHDEATRGRDRHCLVPLSIDGAEAPLGFRQFQTIDLSRDRKRAPGHEPYSGVVRAVALLHDRTVAPVESSTARPATGLGIDRRVLIGGGAVLAGAAVAGVWWTGLLGGTSAAENSIAVLPFDNLSGNSERAYFSDGLAAEVRSQLARNPLLQVVAQASSNQFRDADADAKTISRSLGVGYLLDGNVRGGDGMLRITAELIDGRSGFTEWSQTFDRAAADVFAVQEEIAAAVTGALTAEVIGRAQGGTEPGGRGTGTTQSVAAYDAFLRGRDLFNRGSDEASDRAALAAFDEAISFDPRYALAHSSRARTLTVIGNQYDQGTVRRASYAQAIGAANRGVELAPNVAETQSALGFALFNGRIDARAARPPYEKSFALGRGDADVLSRYALYSARCGRIDAARPAIARAATLDPLNARIFRQVGDVEYSARRYVEAIPPIQRALQINPELAVAHAAIGACKLLLGDVASARTEYEAEPNSLFKLTGLAIVNHVQRRTAEAEASMAQLVSENGDNSLYQQAQVLAQWGRTELAMARLQAAAEEIDAGLVYLRNDPFVDPLRRLPQFGRLLGRLGFS